MTEENDAESEKPKKDENNPGNNRRDRILRLPEVMERTGLSRATIYRFVGKGLFPAPMQLPGRNIGWRESDIDDWISRLAIRPARLRPIHRPPIQRRPTKKQLDRAKPVRPTPKPFYPDEDDGPSPQAS